MPAVNNKKKPTKKPHSSTQGLQPHIFYPKDHWSPSKWDIPTNCPQGRCWFPTSQAPQGAGQEATSTEGSFVLPTLVSLNLLTECSPPETHRVIFGGTCNRGAPDQQSSWAVQPPPAPDILGPPQDNQHSHSNKGEGITRTFLKER